MPRESRDTLFLLAVIGWTVLPHVAHLPLWCSVLTAVVLAWRCRLAITLAPLPGRWVLLALLGTSALATWSSFGTLLGREPGVTLAVVLMALKTLELRARRDAFVVFFLGFFLVLTHFLYSQALPVAIAMIVSVWGLLTSLVLSHMPVGQPALKGAAALAARTALLGAPIMALLFVLFPRVGPLWGVPQDGLGRTGLSSQMELGSVAEIANDDSVAMRLRFLGPGAGPPPPETRYFRGPVLGHFDGRAWSAYGVQARSAFRPSVRPRALLQVDGAPLRHEVTLEPLKLSVVPMLEATAEMPAIEGYSVQQRDDLTWTSDRPIFERLRFIAAAHPRFRHGPLDPVLGLQDYVDLPPAHNPRTLEWAMELRRRMPDADASTLVQAVLTHIRQGGFTYTLAPGVYGQNDSRTAIDEFWLDRREGFCEHFASAFVIVMRALDVPARVVTGYQGIDPEPVDGYWLVRQSAAHAWAEYWQAGSGWIRADPTAAVAPDRIRGTLPARASGGLATEGWGPVDPALLANLRNGWSAIDNRWNQWVLSYGRSRQLGLMRSFGLDATDWQDLALMLLGSLSVLAAAVAGMGVVGSGTRGSLAAPARSNSSTPVDARHHER